MSLSSSQMQAQAKPAEDIEDIIELQADVTKVPLEQIIELKDVPLWTGWYWIGGGALLLIALLFLLFTRKRKPRFPCTFRGQLVPSLHGDHHRERLLGLLRPE